MRGQQGSDVTRSTWLRKAQHAFTSHALAIVERLGYASAIKWSLGLSEARVDPHPKRDGTAVALPAAAAGAR